jgi:hypothetical protein
MAGCRCLFGEIDLRMTATALIALGFDSGGSPALYHDAPRCPCAQRKLTYLDNPRSLSLLILPSNLSPVDLRSFRSKESEINRSD